MSGLGRYHSSTGLLELGIMTAGNFFHDRIHTPLGYLKLSGEE
jgi:hypothetical protein